MNKEQLEELEQIKENIISIADWCVQENKKLDNLLIGRLKGYGINRETESLLY